MGSIAISINGLGKRYRLGRRAASYETIREALLNGLTAPLRWLRGEREEAPTIWALEDVSFDVQRGQVLGLVGANGAGKTTLLKILSRITEPTTGRVVLHGRVGSLLEVGTGFHPELTGRENVFLNGAILGMARAEIRRKFSEIIAFAEVDEFVDTPVKHYSTGMHVRLAFAVAAHLEPEILLVDEVLSVGDAAFQKKCLGKMGEVAGEGRTVLFVSHNMTTIRSLCDEAKLLRKGRLTAAGTPNQVIAAYLEESARGRWAPGRKRPTDAAVWADQIVVTQEDVEVQGPASPLLPTEVRVSYEVSEQVQGLLLGFDVLSSEGVHLFRSYDLEQTGQERASGRYVSTMRLPEGLFQPGSYYLDFLLAIHRKQWISRNESRIQLTFGEQKVLDVSYPGVLRPVCSWEVRKAEEGGESPG